MRDVIHNLHVKVPLCMQSHVAWTQCSLAALADWLAVLLAVLIVRCWVEVEMAGHDPYCYWDISFLSRLIDVYGQYIQLLRGLGFSRTMPTISRPSHLLPAGLAPWAHLTCLFKTDILPREAEHEYCYDLCCTSTDWHLTWCSNELKSTVCA